MHADERSITMSDWWHEYFLWKCEAKKQWRYNAEEIGRCKKIWFGDWYYNVFYRRLNSPKNLWGEDVSKLSEDVLTEYPMSAYISILYYRNLISVYEGEFSALQLECEILIEKTSRLYDAVDEADRKLRKLIVFGKETARRKKAEAEHEIDENKRLINQKMARADELRQLILLEQSN